MSTKSILIVDDDELLCDMLATLLEIEGYDVGVAHHGQQGLEMLAAQRFDCIILDLVMPRMDGLQFMRTLAAKGTDHPPIVVISASVTADILEEGRDYGVAGMIKKPVQAHEVGRIVARVTGGA